MSFATLCGTLDECSLISKLEITKNPFDSEMDERLNLPALSSPSIFTKQETPGSQKKKGFRWSIDQISKLNPADIDEFPNQEYSSTYDRPEDETRAQEAINEYFSHGTILPSPWTPESEVKHVTFSPLPPSTAYISSDESMATDISHATSYTSGCRQVLDVGCQTTLTFPPSFDLSKIVDSGFYSYVEEEGSLEARDLNVSSLRRKLFSQDDNSSPMKSAVEPSSSDRPKMRSILKSPSPLNLLTSSPLKDRRYLHPERDSPFSRGSKTSPSPGISPIKPPATLLTKDSPQEAPAAQVDGTVSKDDVFTSNVLESSDVFIDPSLLPDVSPIKDPNAHDPKPTDQHDDSNEEYGAEQTSEKPSDGGPMKLSELSNVKMDYQNEDENNNEMDIAELQLLRTTNKEINHDLQTSASHGTRKHDPGDHVTCNVSDDITDDVATEKNGDVTGKKSDQVAGDADDDVNDVICCASSEVLEGRHQQFSSQSKEIGKDNLTWNIGGVYEEMMSLQPAERDDVDSDGRLRRRRVQEDTWEPNKENIGETFYENYANQVSRSRTMDDKADSALLKRASAAMRRAEKLVRETCMEQEWFPKKTGTTTRFLKWSSVDGAPLWHPIDMSTPVVNEKFMKNPLVLKTEDASGQRRRHLSDLDSYNNLLSSFANSKLDQGPRSYCPVNHDSGVETIESDYYSRTRGRTTGLELRRRRSLTDISNSLTHDVPRDFYLSGRYGYCGTPGKRFSWPPWKTSRSRYHFNGRSMSPTVPCGQSRLRYRAMDDRSKIRRSDESKILARLFNNYHDKYADYFDGMHSYSRKSYCR